MLRTKSSAPRFVEMFVRWVDCVRFLLMLIVFPFGKSPRFSKKRLGQLYQSYKGAISCDSTCHHHFS